MILASQYANMAAHQATINALNKQIRPNRQTFRKESKLSDEIEFEINEEVLNFYKQSFNYKKEKS